VTIDLERHDEAGITDYKWEVTYNSKHGQPGPLAYKVDTLVINRLLDQLGRPLPELVRIGSMSDVCRLLGTKATGPNLANLKAAFLQNASAFINAKIRYKTKSGREKWAEVAYTRYSVVFTGEALPDGRQADAVHVILNPPYRELLNHVETRPLDYEYLRRLSPGPQRFYELLSFQIYGAIAGGRMRAKLLYSDYCKCAPQVRYYEFDRVKKQMFKLHVPHREAGYITTVDYQECKDAKGQPDWEVFYVPGPKAFAEYNTFTSRIAAIDNAGSSPTPERTVRKQVAASQTTLDLSIVPPDVASVLEELTRRGVVESKARELIANLKPGQEVMDQIEYVDSLVQKDRRRKIENPPGLYVYYIRDNLTPPADFWSSRKIKLQQQAQEKLQSEQSELLRAQLAYEEYQEAALKRFVESMDAEEYDQLFKQERRANRRRYPQMPVPHLDNLSHRDARRKLIETGRVTLMSFDEFVRLRQADPSTAVH